MVLQACLVLNDVKLTVGLEGAYWCGFTSLETWGW